MRSASVAGRVRRRGAARAVVAVAVCLQDHALAGPDEVDRVPYARPATDRLVDVRTGETGAPAHGEHALLQLAAGEGRADDVLLQRRAQRGDAATARGTVEQLLDGPQVEGALHLGLVAGALGLAAIGDGGESEQGQRDRRARDAIDDGSILRLQLLTAVDPQAGDHPRSIRWRRDLDQRL
jgi:hypothetical protein